MCNIQCSIYLGIIIVQVRGLVLFVTWLSQVQSSTVPDNCLVILFLLPTSFYFNCSMSGIRVLLLFRSNKLQLNCNATSRFPIAVSAALAARVLTHSNRFSSIHSFVRSFIHSCNGISAEMKSASVHSILLDI